MAILSGQIRHGVIFAVTHASGADPDTVSNGTCQISIIHVKNHKR